MKPLTIEELRVLKVEDWVWIIDKEDKSRSGYYKVTTCSNGLVLFAEGTRLRNYIYSNYGTKWLAYKNKE